MPASFLGVYKRAAKRLGYNGLDEVKCAKCGLEQFYYYSPEGRCMVRHNEAHHIFPICDYPELSRCCDNIVFMCHHHHCEFHWTYDVHLILHETYSVTLTASAEDLYEYLNLTQIGTTDETGY